MSDQKSKLPDLNEIVGMANKLFKDLKVSVCEIVDEYKAKRAETESVVKPESKIVDPIEPAEPLKKAKKQNAKDQNEQKD